MSWTKRLRPVILMGGVFVAGCGGAHALVPGTDAAAEAAPSGTDAAADASDARVPLYHRSTSASCPSERAPGPSGQPYPVGVATTCTSDSQCTVGTDGRCFPFEGLVGPGGCSYDECFADSDCGSGATCLCRNSSADNSANVCVHGGNCLVDSDCGPGNYCSPSLVESCQAPGQYFCHTALDTCLNDSDCGPADPNGLCGSTNLCAFDMQAHRWTCTQANCCPP